MIMAGGHQLRCPLFGYGGDMEKIINGQGREQYRNIPFGKSTVGHSGCGAIAIYNVLAEKGISVELKDVIRVTKRLNCMLAWGFFGIWPKKLGDILSYYNIYFEKINLAEYEGKAGDVFVVTIFNDRRKWYFGGLHTFEMAYRPDNHNAEKPWIVFNRVDNSIDCVRYRNPDDVLITYGKKYKPIYGKYFQVLKIV